MQPIPLKGRAEHASVFETVPRIIAERRNEDKAKSNAAVNRQLEAEAERPVYHEHIFMSTCLKPSKGFKESISRFHTRRESDRCWINGGRRKLKVVAETRSRCKRLKKRHFTLLSHDAPEGVEEAEPKSGQAERGSRGDIPDYGEAAMDSSWSSLSTHDKGGPSNPLGSNAGDS